MHNDRIDAVTGLAQQNAWQFLTFQLDRELFGLNIAGIHEIIEYRPPTPVPTMPACVCGVINLRGAVVPVVDLQSRLGRGPSQVTRRSCIVIATATSEEGGAAQSFGLLVDAVNEVLELPPQQIEAPPAFGSDIRRDLLQGMGKLEDRLVILLDRARLLRSDDIAEAGARALAA
ncbi:MULTISPECIES: chemotaxis protein CheW [Xanthomonas]|uniref:Chemotaxis protein CheW n=1 Tax=Xanthomonas rydalmerensis TaxID=3046274 RepID=A0ABZ0JI88_9XANT|nr:MULTISPECIES: chemotaxis protein CheW [unclassified Xanthomonas]MBB5878110.1 purine-binding chemotaxis protein CheW [Xanthomonas sp. 3498]MBB5940871.1 purine-binding chemotaxis protein CheW [Xanthomonas sp. 3307]MXV08715.1 chemotaxis protein CheW [Xanthomonas sp. LMG 9002]WOS39519.1 chemotaxis protein CheW [Xanthomonas sp. DM-2023]WOS43703.1 chemotaxis protein CheW [Xanthomonas sp. DM-2023]